MEDEPKVESPEKAKVFLRGEDLSAYFWGGSILTVVMSCGLLHILASKGWWNPLHWRGRFWTGVLMILAPASVAMMATLPEAMRKKVPDKVVELTILALWVAFFWAACGGR